MCYCCERINEAANITWGGSSGVRFYMNSIYHYVSSMFLVDASKPSHKDLPMGGTLIRALHPIGLGYLLDPIKMVLEEPFGERTFGETNLHLRHIHLVHGDFSLGRIEHLIEQTQMRDPIQQERFASLIRDLFYELLRLDLILLAMMTAPNVDFLQIVARYLKGRQAR